MKVISFLISLFVSLPLISQDKNTDTMYLKAKDLKFCFEEFERLTQTGGKYYYNGKEIDHIKYAKIRRYSESICDSLFEKKAFGKYCKFYNKDSIVILEGIWNPEFFMGPYKEYYDNGKIKTEGEYSESDVAEECGIKKGRWVYYKKNGKVKRIEIYSK